MKKIESKKVGPIIGTLVVLIVIVTIILYLFATHINKQALVSDSIASSSDKSLLVNADDVQTLKNDLNNAIK